MRAVHFTALLCATPLLWTCNRKPDISLEISVPSDVIGMTTWIELGVLQASTCPPLASLGGGIPATGTLARLGYNRSDPKSPALGDLPAGTYAFAAVAKRDDCGVLAAGCSVVDVQKERDVSIAMKGTGTTGGACGTGFVCSAARCSPQTDDRAAGENCSLQLLGSGPLGDPLSQLGTSVGTPAIVARPNGFFIAYREFAGGTTRVTLIPIDSSGGQRPAQVNNLSKCSAEEATDATAMDFSGEQGGIALTRSCGNGGAPYSIDVLRLDANGIVMDGSGKPSFGSTGAQEKPFFYTGHALAQNFASPGSLILAFTQSGTARSATLSGVQFDGSSDAFRSDGPSFAAVATTDKVTALLAGGSSMSGAGAGMTGDGGADAAPSPAPTRSGLSLDLRTPGSSSTLPPVSIQGTWSSLSAEGSRVFVATSGTKEAVAWYTYDLNQSGVVAGKSGEFSNQDPGASSSKVSQTDGGGGGTVLFADVVVHQNLMIFAVERLGELAVVAYDHASTTPTFLRVVHPRIPLFANARDGRIVVAASDTRVAVAWATAKKLDANDVVGGYAVFACIPKP